MKTFSKNAANAITPYAINVTVISKIQLRTAMPHATSTYTAISATLNCLSTDKRM